MVKVTTSPNGAGGAGSPSPAPTPRLTPEERRQILLATNDIAPGDRAALQAALAQVARLLAEPDPADFWEAFGVAHLLEMSLAALDYQEKTQEAH